MSNILHVECADGQSLPYLGYIQCSLKAKGIDNNQVCVDGLFLIVPNTSYNKGVPVLIGTNIISVLMNLVKESHGLRYLQEANLFAPWHLAFRCVSLRDKELQRHKNVLALVRLAESSRVTIPPNTDVVVIYIKNFHINQFVRCYRQHLNQRYLKTYMCLLYLYHITIDRME